MAVYQCLHTWNMTAEWSCHRGVLLIVGDSVTFGICAFIWGRLLKKCRELAVYPICILGLEYSYQDIPYPFTMVLVVIIMMAHFSLSLSRVCEHSLYSAEGGTGRCVMPCAVMPCPTLASCPLSLPCSTGMMMGSEPQGNICMCVRVWTREWFPFLSLNMPCVCVPVCTWAYDSPLALGMWRW